MKIPYYQIDAFVTDKTFSGNPAGVCILEEWLPDDVLQGIAFENNLSETAFIIEDSGAYRLRWFTPTLEVDLCGHATLAPAFLIMTSLQPGRPDVTFRSKSGDLFARQSGDLTEIDFPSRPATECAPPDGLVESIGARPVGVYKSRDYLLLYEHEAQIRAISPDMARLAQVDCFAVIVSARGEASDFVSRFFAPKAGIPEDPVTGSAHSTLIPFWAGRLGKDTLHARQLSPRGGELFCRHQGDRALMAGRCRVYFEGRISV